MLVNATHAAGRSSAWEGWIASKIEGARGGLYGARAWGWMHMLYCAEPAGAGLLGGYCGAVQVRSCLLACSRTRKRASSGSVASMPASAAVYVEYARQGLALSCTQYLLWSMPLAAACR